MDFSFIDFKNRAQILRLGVVYRIQNVVILSIWLLNIVFDILPVFTHDLMKMLNYGP